MATKYYTSDNYFGYNAQWYEIRCNGQLISKICGKTRAIRAGKAASGNLFGERKIEVINTDTGEIITI